MRITYLIAAFVLFSTVNAQLFGNFCPDLYAGSSLDKSLASATTYGGLISISLLLVLLVLMCLGIAYAFGYGFGIDSLKKFTRAEALESAFNLIIIGAIASGLAFANGAVSFLASISSVGLSALTPNSVIPSNVPALYLGLCNNYINTGVASVIPDVVSTAAVQGVLAGLQSFNIALEPNYFGFSFSPLAGIQPVVTMMGTQVSFFMLMIGVFVSIPLLLYLVYFLFPVFLYVGVLLRSFPWTRAAGGSMLALFIAFYIVFPSLLYPFSAYISSQFKPLSLGSLSGAGFSLQSLLTVMPLSSVFGNPLYAEIGGFASQATFLAIQLLGLIISLIISLDLMEALGDMLGSPSLQSKKLLSKVI
jgi:hypothetical protein